MSYPLVCLLSFVAKIQLGKPPVFTVQIMSSHFPNPKNPLSRGFLSARIGEEGEGEGQNRA